MLLTVLIQEGDEVSLTLEPALQLLGLHVVQGPLLAGVDLGVFHFEILWRLIIIRIPCTPLL